jgi:hypothetical protein
MSPAKLPRGAARTEPSVKSGYGARRTGLPAIERLIDGSVVEADIAWSQAAFLVEGDEAAIARLRAQVGDLPARLRYADIVDLVEPWMRKFGYLCIPGVDRAIPHWSPELARAKAALTACRVQQADAVRSLVREVSRFEQADPAGFAHASGAAAGPRAEISAEARAWVRRRASDPAFRDSWHTPGAAAQATQDAVEAYRRAVRGAATAAPRLGD